MKTCRCLLQEIRSGGYITNHDLVPDLLEKFKDKIQTSSKSLTYPANLVILLHDIATEQEIRKIEMKHS